MTAGDSRAGDGPRTTGEDVLATRAGEGEGRPGEGTELTEGEVSPVYGAKRGAGERPSTPEETAPPYTEDSIAPGSTRDPGSRKFCEGDGLEIRILGAGVDSI